jgi:hypothetical protein
MWRWLTDMFAGKNTPTGTEGGDRLVSDEEYDFRFGTKAKLPEGLRNLKVTELGDDLLLDNFDIDLTVDQKYMDRTAEEIAMASRSLRWAKTYHRLDEQPRPPIRLYRNNLMLFASHFSEKFPPENNLSLWLNHLGWPSDRPVTLHEATTKKPLEDGFFTCARLTVGDVADESGLHWHPQEATSTSVVDVLADFVRREMVQPWGEHGEGSSGQSCEAYLESCYSHLPREQLTHPVFALLHFPTFDMGTVKATFAGSILSENELRFWSRPTYFHK